MTETPTSKNTHKVVPLILVILTAIFFLISCKKNKQKEELFIQNSNPAKIAFNCETSCTAFSAKYSPIGLRIFVLNNHSCFNNQIVINV
jgi:hypothetical protein